jgi:hypothetical protein
MGEPDEPPRSLLEAAAIRFARVERVLYRVRGGVHALGESFFSHALSAREQTQLSGALYDREFRPETQKTELMDWEVRWFEQQLPPPPARVLVGAAGGGRECVALVDRGYEVDGFDPSPAAVAHAERRLAGRGRVAVGSYADLGGPRLSWLRSRYDAVLLGWGSLSHVIGEPARRGLFVAVDELAGEGPVLSSFYLADADSSSPGRVARLGQRLGEWVGQRRGASAGEPVSLTYWGGFVHELAVEEIQALAGGISRSAEWHLTDGMPHVTLRRRRPARV